MVSRPRAVVRSAPVPARVCVAAAAGLGSGADRGFSMYTYVYPHPAVTVDVALFAGHGAERRLLLIRRAQPPYAGYWALPGGFVDIDEDLPDAARRELAAETGLSVAGLRQLGAYGAPGRDPRERVISVVYLAELPSAQPPAAGSDAAEAAWFDLAALPALAFDHAGIIEDAVAALGWHEPPQGRSTA